MRACPYTLKMIAGADFVRYLFSAGGVVCCFFLVAVWVAWSRNSLPARRWLMASALVFAASSLYGPQYLIARAMAWPLKPITAADVRSGHRTAIVVLGSGSVDVEDWSGRTYSFVDHSAAARVLEAVRVFNMVNGAIVISSGGNPHREVLEKPSAETMRDALIILGVPADRIMTETASRTTRDEAVIIRDMLRAQNIDQMILVTSQTHMRRALGAFRAAGVEAIPAIAQELDRHLPITQMLLPSADGLWVASTNVHEALGLAYYWARGWWGTAQHR